MSKSHSSSSLEDRLSTIINHAIVRDNRMDSPLEVEEEAVNSIIEAFKEDGWAEPLTDEERETLIASYAAAEYIKSETMTGEEWWDRWNEEFDKLSPLPPGMTERGRGIEAAKRASKVK